MRTMVVVTAAETDRLAALALPHTPRTTVRGGSVHRFYYLPNGKGTPRGDLIEIAGFQLLVSYRSFETIEDAEAWVCREDER